MDDQPNPYESPQTESRIVPPSGSNATPPRDGWKFILLAVAIVCGLASFLPWLAVILGIISSPVFVRYFLIRRQAEGSAPPTPGTVVAGMTGAIGLGIGILAASAGALLGVCSATVWSGVGLFAFVGQGDQVYQAAAVAFVCGIVLGLGAFILTLVWLPERVWPRKVGPS
jgi:hypothetical protein